MSKAKSQSLVAIDSMILVWGIRKEGPEDRLERAKWLFAKLDHDQSQIVVPSIVIAEYLSHVDVRKHAETIELMNNRFIISPFDVRAASLAADLFRQGLEERGDKGSPDGRKCLRADSLIVATARSQGVSVFYSHDKHCRTMATRARMEAFDLPTTADNLFD